MYTVTSCTLTTLHCRKVSFLQCCHMKRYKIFFFKCEGCIHFCEILYMIHIYIYISYMYIIIIILLTYCISCHLNFMTLLLQRI